MKIKLPKKLKNLKVGQSDWQKAFFWAVIISILVYVVAAIYLFFKPVDEASKKIIDAEVKSINITFDQKTIDNIKLRLEIPSQATPQTGKNPFTP